MLHTNYQSSMSSSFREEDFQRFCNFFPFGSMATRVMNGIEFFEQFYTASPKEHHCQVSSRLVQWFRRRRRLKKLLMDAGHRVISIVHSEHFVLRWAKKKPLLTMWEKEKMAAISIFSFPHIVFYSVMDKFCHLSHFELITRRQNFRLVQIETNCLQTTF